LDKARAANALALAETGAPASVARLKAAVGVGQGKAQQLRDALATRPDAIPAPLPAPRTDAPGVAAPVEHANGRTRPTPDAR
jgi:hypothetical protein